MAPSKEPRARARRAALALFGMVLPLLGTGCYAEARTGAVVRTDYEPAHVEVYPREYYDGRTVYLINDRWYYQDGGRWVYYRSEPEVLVRRRTVIRQAPPVVRERTVVHQAPPAHPHYRYEADPSRRRAGRRVVPPAQ